MIFFQSINNFGWQKEDVQETLKAYNIQITTKI